MYKNIEKYLGFSGRSSMGEVQTPTDRDWETNSST